MKSQEIRKKFFDFFIERGHEKVPSSSLIPAQDPTLLFANAGMNQFKDVFLGKEKRSYTRATSIQKCMRAGGKHNDLDNVGFTKRHLTFFEMMGNFSFGDYFKKDAIQFAWDFLTKDMKLPVEKLHTSVFTTDNESYDLWLNMIGVSKDKIHRLGAADNFWQMGDTGPCGPCTEIHLDQGKDIGCKQSNCGPECDCERFVEIWNLVFMQFNRQKDGTDIPLGQTGVDTGMGLERLCMVVQEKDSVFETDLFSDIIYKIELLSEVSYEKSNAELKAAFHVLSDHIRASTFLISDGCAPSNEGRGYVLRKIIRRAALFSQKLTDKIIFPELVSAVVVTMEDVYPELKTNQELVKKVLKSEIEKFSANLIRGKSILEEYFEKNKKDRLITGPQAFRLYDTYGFPLELTIAMAKERDYAVDTQGFEKEMEKQQAQSGKKIEEAPKVQLDENIKTDFTGYQELKTESEITAIICEDKAIGQLAAGKECWIVTKKSPFYIVGGGQVKDEGWIQIGDVKTKLLDVEFFDNAIGMKIKSPKNIKSGDKVTLIVNKNLRTESMKNHTATHLLQSALVQLFGKQIKQSGSYVCPDYLRFDFSYHENLSLQQIQQVEELVNQKIMENIDVCTKSSTYKNAIEKGVTAFFGDKYDHDNVRIVQVEDFSSELCGGTHVKQTGEIGSFKITEVTALSAGHRRIFAVTGPKAVELFQDCFNTVKTLSQEFKVQRNQVLEMFEKQKEQLKKLQTEIKAFKKQALKDNISVWQEQITEINGVPTLILTLENASHDEMKTITNTLMQKTPGFYFMTSNSNGKALFISTIAKEHAARINMKHFSQFIKDKHNLRGGGSLTTIQGGGPTAIDKELQDSIIAWVKEQK